MIATTYPPLVLNPRGPSWARRVARISLDSVLSAHRLDDGLLKDGIATPYALAWVATLECSVSRLQGYGIRNTGVCQGPLAGSIQVLGLDLLCEFGCVAEVSAFARSALAPFSH